jgi:flagellar biosynthesis protein FlhF
MKIVRHTARDMRQALRGVREQLGENAVILSSRRIPEGIEITAAVDFDASSLEADGFANTPAGVAPPAAASAVSRGASGGRSAPARGAEPARGAAQLALAGPVVIDATATISAPTALAGPAALGAHAAAIAAAANIANAATATPVSQGPALSYEEVAAAAEQTRAQSYAPFMAPAYEPDSISAAARAAVAEFTLQASATQTLERVAPAAGTPTASRASVAPQTPATLQATAATRAPAYANAADQTQLPTPTLTAPPTLESAPAPTLTAAPDYAGPTYRTEVPRFRADDAVEQAYASALLPFGPADEPKSSSTQAVAASSADVQSVTDAMGNELKTLRRMLETQFAQLAWNDLTRRAPIHTEILRELTEIGVTADLADHLIRQLPNDTDLTFARRFAIAGLSQYLRVTGDRWLDNGGRVAFIGSTGVGKTTTLAKFAVRWVLRHGTRDIALVAGDCIRIGAHDQLRSLAQLLGVPVYAPEKFESLPTLLENLRERLILVDTPGASLRDPQATSRLAVLANSASRLETALVLAASTQAGALEEAVKHFAPANPACCVLTKLDEAASLGGALSVLIRARLPISYVSEGQRVPEDLRPARALELVSGAVRLAKASGAAADEDLLRRRYGKTAHALT